MAAVLPELMQTGPKKKKKKKFTLEQVTKDRRERRGITLLFL
jgi:hypothetical protein